MRLTLADGARVLRTGEFVDTLTWDNLPVERWWPNGHGTQKLYTVTCVPVDGGESRSWRVGFKAVRWEPCAGAPAGADPWLCVVNDRPIFLQGVNWSPIRPNFADVTEAEVRTRLETYRDLGCNVLRVWGGAVLEKESFYNACDELGLLVWQEFPLSSSGADNWPPEDPRAIDEMAAIAASYIERRQHHVSLLLWCGGNELQGDLEGGKTGCGKPVTNDHPLIGRLAATVARLDPSRRFLPSSASGPRFVADAKDFGNGLHWDVHGPWRGETEEYWQRDDALFRSEVGAPGASPAAVINQYAGGLPVLPGSLANPLWRRVSWWLEWPEFLAEQGREPRDLEEFVAWSQQRQAVFLTRAVAACQGRFPRCGGIILWMGHDSFPCPTNTAILDFHGQEKPAALAVGKLFRAHASQLARTPAADAG
jgi:beta-mannosidase